MLPLWTLTQIRPVLLAVSTGAGPVQGALPVFWKGPQAKVEKAGVLLQPEQLHFYALGLCVTLF